MTEDPRHVACPLAFLLVLQLLCSHLLIPVPLPVKYPASRRTRARAPRRAAPARDSGHASVHVDLT